MSQILTYFVINFPYYDYFDLKPETGTTKTRLFTFSKLYLPSTNPQEQGRRNDFKSGGARFNELNKVRDKVL